MNNFFRRFCLIILIFMISTFIYAKENKDESKDIKKAEDDDYMNIEVSLKSGLMNGEIREYVFDPNCKNTDNKMSELDWDVSKIPVLNFSADFDILNYVYTGFSGSIGVPVTSGNMQDYDWLNSLYSDWRNDDATELTNYSCHTNKLDKYMNFTVMLGGNIQLPAKIKLTLFAAYQYDFIGFTGHDGYTIYKSDDFKQIDMEEGKVISYNVDTNAVLFGLKTQINTIPRTLITAGFSCSPSLSSISAFDFHYRNGDRYSPYGNAYWDKCDKVWQFEAELSALYKFNEHHRLGFYGNIYYVPTSKSTTYTKRLKQNGLTESGAWTQYTDGSAGGYDRFTWTVSINYSFLL